MQKIQLNSDELRLNSVEFFFSPKIQLNSAELRKVQLKFS